MNEPIEKFWNLCSNAKITWENEIDAKILEPFYLAILKHVKNHPELNDTFKEFFVRISKDRRLAPWEVVAFVMRDLRWKEVRDAVYEYYVTSEDFRVKSVMESILAVYEDEWEDADMYEYYSKEK